MLPHLRSCRRLRLDDLHHRLGAGRPPCGGRLAGLRALPLLRRRPLGLLGRPVGGTQQRNRSGAQLVGHVAGRAQLPSANNQYRLLGAKVKYMPAGSHFLGNHEMHTACSLVVVILAPIGRCVLCPGCCLRLCLLLQLEGHRLMESKNRGARGAQVAVAGWPGLG